MVPTNLLHAEVGSMVDGLEDAVFVVLLVDGSESSRYCKQSQLRTISHNQKSSIASYKINVI